jgi:SAM-dependent methyltransferase
MNKQTQKNLLNLVKKNYEEIAPDFDLTRQKEPWPELLKLTSLIKNNDSILDVGCGNGRLIDAFGNKSIRYIGVDNNPKLINIAKKNYELRIKNYEFFIGDILDLGKIPQINFDYIFCVAVLHHLPGQDLRIQALKQLKNKVKPDGKIIISVWNLWSQKKYRNLIIKHSLLKILRKNKMDWGDIIFEWKNSEGKSLSERYYHAFTKWELKKIVHQANLKISRLDKDKYNYYLILTK